MEEKKLHRRVEISDEALGKVQGGSSCFEKMIHHGADGSRVYWTGGVNNRDLKYLCPKCGRPLHLGTAGRYYCDPCDESWFDEYVLQPNMASGMWVNI